jgi:uncharacterized protein YPO0396
MESEDEQDSPAPDLDTQVGIVNAFARIERSIGEIKRALDHLPMIEEHLAILGSQLDSIGTLQMRTFSRSITPQAAEIETKRAKEEADKIEKLKQEEMDARIKARGGDHPPTPEEIASAEEEFA